MDLGLQDRVYVVTGATRGLGRATADLLVAEGAMVVVSSRSEVQVASTVAQLGERARGVVADNADPAGAERIVAAAVQGFGRLDGALISVGGPPPGSILERSDDDLRAAFDSILLGAVRLAREVVGALGEGGSIAFVLSTSVKQPIAGLGLSNALRPGLAMAAKSMADELGPRGIRVNGLLPGRVETERVQELDAGSEDPAATRARHVASIPLRRYGRPEEFAAAAAFLLAPVSSYLTGVMLPVDGGISRGL